MLASDIMRTSFATVKPEAPLLEALHLLLETNQRGLPVLNDDGTLVGIIAEGDFLHRRELGVNYPEGFWLEWLLGRQEGELARERTRGLRVEEVMSRHPVCVDENASIDAVVKEMDVNLAGTRAPQETGCGDRWPDADAHGAGKLP
ncbi:CBS domain-containing protein [Bradyrhizobium japonicum]|uniref:CBS domain-containing protein n=1 Tax=Bradyrhizobium TaxID=374 RepID=UPI00041E517B|nr:MULTISPECIES: CBS domain-containing protein [Bradyrhizobium]MCP1744133.1 CBS domain-containing protein [Bradyrhizobium japonicum]MCP1782423.1 CBS domain-containing protein [Bradyrhizobium japonicum]MCP1861851.1 CBS domain-containing protein [Bradyrhizobium japonicum]MCP1892607.1 CBS domain-containing protein [Bradyrhizobium japonicum]MCP1965287.1 CBS domain-containing protein [Bradyrhizobium japonicum]